MLAEIIITAMGCVTWDTSKISSMAKFGLSAGQKMYLVPYNPPKTIFLMIYSHFFFFKLARLCVTWDSRQILAKTTNSVTCDGRINWNGTVCTYYKGGELKDLDVTIFFLCSFLVIIVPLHFSIFSLNFHLFHMHSLAVHRWPHAQSCCSNTASSAVLLFTHSLMHSLIHSHIP